MAANDGAVYLEVDEDITSAIDKLNKVEGGKVQIVTAKRSTLFQSVINLKLLQKAAKDAKKELVLVTGDRVATNLAGRLGVPVATQVGEAASVPSDGAAAAAVSDDEIDGGTVSDEDGGTETEPEPAKEPEFEPEPEIPSAAPASAAAGAAAKPKPKGQRVPNIGKMQKRLLWAGAGVLVLILLFVANYYLTSAKVTLFAKSNQVNAQFSFTADPNAQQSDIDSATLAAQKLTSNKTLKASVQATGTKDEGSKASGTITVYNSYDSNSHTLVAGTRFVSDSGLVFRSTADVTVPGGSLSRGKPSPGQASVSVQSDANGDQYNLGPSHYSIPGLSSDQQSGIYGQGDQMHGGSSKTATVITAADVSKAQKAALDADRSDALKDLSGKANKQQTVINESLQQSVTSADTNPDVGAEAQTGDLTIQVSYILLAVSKSDLSQLAKAKETDQLGPDNQIYDDGSGSLQFTAAGKPGSDGSQKFSANATAYAGTKIDTGSLVNQLKGQKYGDAQQTASQVPGVEKAEVKLSPGWATKVPHVSKHIHVEIKAASASG